MSLYAIVFRSVQAQRGTGTFHTDFIFTSSVLHIISGLRRRLPPRSAVEERCLSAGPLHIKGGKPSLSAYQLTERRFPPNPPGHALLRSASSRYGRTAASFWGATAVQSFLLTTQIVVVHSCRYVSLAVIVAASCRRCALCVKERQSHNVTWGLWDDT